MKAYLLDRSGLADSLSGRKGRSSAMDSWRAIRAKKLPKQRVIAVWADDDQYGLPNILVVRDSESRDWLAWLVTFAPSLQPFTAYCRVVEQAELRSLATGTQLRLPAGSLGLILGEVLSAAASRGQMSPRPHPIALYSTTLSYALARATMIVPGVELEWVAERWQRIRNLTGQRAQTLPPRDILSASHILALLSEGRGQPRAKKSGVDWISQVAAALKTGGPDAALALLEKEDTWYAASVTAMSGSRDSRVGAFESAVRRLRSHGRSDPWDDFFVGLLGSLIGPGGLAHAPLVAQSSDICPSALLWYAVCASLCDERQFLSELGGVARRIERDLTTPFDLLARPRCDLAQAELDIYLDTPAQKRTFLTAQPTLVSVELFPGVEVSARWAVNELPHQPDVQGRERARIVEDIRTMSERLRHLAISLAGDGRPEGQQGLFDNPTADRPQKRKTKRR